MTGVAVLQICRGREWRGGERQVRLLAKMLRGRAGLTQTIATGAGSRLQQALVEDGQQVLALAWNHAYDPRAWLGVVRQVRRMRRDPAPLVLHAHDSHAVALGLFASRRLGVPLVATRRSVTPAGRQWRGPSRVIAISHAVEQALLASGVAPARISVIPSAIDLATVQRATDPAPPSAAFIVAAGALTPEKGHATLIEAFARITADRPEMRLRILGEGPERRELTERAARLGIGARVDLQGEVEDLSASIAGAALFVQPSYREALGTAVLEAMARGIPVLASGTGGLTELLGGGAGRLVPPHDALALATNIEALLDHPATRADLARLARARVAEYDAPGMADRVVQVYRSALGDT